METEEKRSESSRTKLKKLARIAALTGIFMLVFDFLVWVNFVESTKDYPDCIRTIALIIGIAGIALIVFAGIVALFVRIYHHFDDYLGN